MEKITELHIAAWLACAYFAVMGMNALAKLWRNVRGTPAQPPNDVLEAARKEMERRVAAGEQDLASLRAAVAHEREQVEVSARSRSAGIYNKIEEVRREILSKFDGLEQKVGRQFQDTERTLGRIEGKLSNGH